MSGQATQAVAGRDQARAFAPASVANVAVGFDLLGYAVAGVGDTVTVRRIDAPEVRIAAIRGAAVDLPRQAAANTAGAALIALRQALALHRRAGALHRELVAAEAALAAAANDRNLARLQDIQGQLSTLDGAEAVIEGFGEMSGRLTKDV